MHSQDKERKWYQKKENWWIIAGFITASCAVSLPFILMKYFNSGFVLDSFTELGVVGDFFGGTTVGLLSLTSILFVTAAIIMQKQELGLQREEIQKTRQEYEITNATMKKQQFDSTFFNMINLHHNITKEITLEKAKGREVMKIVLEKLREVYNNDVYNEYNEKLKKEAFQGDKELLDELIRNQFFNKYLIDFISDNEPTPVIDHLNSEIDTTAYEQFHESLTNGTNKKWNDQIDKLNIVYENFVYMQDDSYQEWLKDFDIRNASNSYSTTYTKKYERDFISNPLKELKEATFEKVYNNYESQLGHYFRNLYHIVKLIEDQNFHENELENNIEKRKYRAILRAQLSSNELLVVFYNVVYSKNGDKFKKLLIDKHFFDDHLNRKEFIWLNDNLEQEKMGL